MKQIPVAFENLSPNQIETLFTAATEVSCKKGDHVFEEGDVAEAFYIIQDGKFSINILKNEKQKQIRTMEAGEYFGEMALLHNDKRSAMVEAMEDSTLYRINKEDFNNLTKEHPELTDAIKRNIRERHEELVLREHLVDETGVDKDSLCVSIKGDFSLRETALIRERYKSVADNVIDELIFSAKDILLNRCVYQMIINFNSGEIRTFSVFDPFREKVHVIDKFVDAAYIERQFPEINYDEKTNLIENIYKFISNDAVFGTLPDYWRSIHNRSYENWNPVSSQSIDKIISRLSDLRNVEDLYLRNVNISIIQDAIRLQFNCDGTHFVSSDNYEKFIEDNFDGLY
jgi:CRP-like cAMP-binding protein